MSIEDLYDVDDDLDDEQVECPCEEDLYETIEADLTIEMDIDGEVIIPDSYFDPNYEHLENLPSINGHVLIGDQTSEDLEIGGDAKLKNDMSVVVTVGGVNAGTYYLKDTDLEKIMRDMLSPVLYPTLVNPSASISATGVKLLEKGATLTTTVTLTLNRGSITPAYGTSGYRSGPATSYSLNGGTPQSGNSFFQTVSESNSSLRGSITYSEGEQPKDSVGEDYGSPLPSGTVQTSTITYEFVNALWANTANIQEVAKLALVSKSAKIKEFSFPEQTVYFPEIFDVPADWTITAVEVLNTLSNQWESCASEFTITNQIHYDAAGTETAYKRYTDNRGYNAGARKVRIKWS